MKAEAFVLSVHTTAFLYQTTATTGSTDTDDTVTESSRFLILSAFYVASDARYARRTIRAAPVHKKKRVEP